MPKNVKLFILFRIFFNARFYYPVFAVLFLDYGLTLEQFSYLNVAWAATIVCLEVPSGALADQLGRKGLIVLSAVIMAIEMGLIAFVPVGNVLLVFSVFLVNRILSGAAEAAASGADEALAYDTMLKEGKEKQWPEVLVQLMRWQSVAFIGAMLIGAMSYDPDFLNACFRYMGWELSLVKEQTMRFPVYLTLLMSFGALVTAWQMQDVSVEQIKGTEGQARKGRKRIRTFSFIRETAEWIWSRKIVFILILIILVQDSVIRLFLTIGSEYYRLIQIPEVWFGVIGAAFAGVGLVIPLLSKKMVEKGSFYGNFMVVAILCWVGLMGAAAKIPYWGVGFVLVLSIAFSVLNFLSSHYLNAEVSSERRATAISFKNLALNIGYGGIGVLYALLLRGIEMVEYGGGEALSKEQKEEIFAESLNWLPWSFLVAVIGVVVVTLIIEKFQTEEQR